MSEVDGDLLRAVGFVTGPKGGLVMGEYTAYLPRDTRSGKCELTHEVPGEKRTDFPPTTERGVLKQIRSHRKSRGA